MEGKSVRARAETAFSPLARDSTRLECKLFPYLFSPELERPVPPRVFLDLAVAGGELLLDFRCFQLQCSAIYTVRRGRLGIFGLAEN